jgi:vacuolar-type H+-ATPase subunit F/Vma7
VIYTLRVVCRPALQEGFALAGVRALPAADARECARLLERLVAEPETGVLLVEDALYRALPDEVREPLERRAVPVVVPFPGPQREEAPAAEVELVEMLRRAIGYRVRLR